MPQTWQELQGIDQATFQKSFGNGEYDGFLKDSEFLNQINSGKLFEKKTTEEAAVVISAPKAEPAPVVEVKVPEGASSEPYWKQKGYESEAEFISKFDNLAAEFQRTQEQVNRLNADRGKEGLKIKKQLEAEQKIREGIEKELLALRDKAITGDPSLQFPEMPLEPIPPNGDFGDEGYLNQRKEYEEKRREWNRKLNESIIDLHKDRVKKDRTISELEGKLSRFQEKSDTSEELTIQERRVKELQNLLEEVDKFQASSAPFSEELKTSKPFSKINEDVLKYGAAVTNMYPKRDLEAFEKLKSIATRYRKFDEKGQIDISVPKQFETLDDLYLIELRKSGGLAKYLDAMKQKEQQEGRRQVIDAIDRNNSGARELPSGGGDRQDVVRTVTDEERMSKLQAYASMPAQEIERNPVAMKEYVTLCDEFGMGSAVPGRWREKIAT